MKKLISALTAAICLTSAIPAVSSGTYPAAVDLTVADLVTFSRWLLGAPDAEISSPERADLNSDGRLDAYDLCLMRRELLTAPIVYNVEISGSPVVNPQKGSVMTTFTPYLFSMN